MIIKIGAYRIKLEFKIYKVNKRNQQTVMKNLPFISEKDIYMTREELEMLNEKVRNYKL